MVWYEPGGKGEKAYDRLEAIQEEANNIKSIIQRIAATLHELVDKTEMKSEPTSKQQRNRPQKVRGMISWLPERIDFTCNQQAPPIMLHFLTLLNMLRVGGSLFMYKKEASGKAHYHDGCDLAMNSSNPRA